MPGTANADNIAQIELTHDGPKSLLPLRKPFYLNLEAKADVAGAQVVFVRYAFRPFGWHPWRTKRPYPGLTRRPPVSCSEVQSALKDIMQDSRDRKRLPAGVQQISALWSPPLASEEPAAAADAATVQTAKKDQDDGDALARESEHKLNTQNYEHLSRHGRALVIDMQAVSDDKKLAFLVHSPGFFVDGAAYCMFVYERRSFSLAEDLYASMVSALFGVVPKPPKPGVELATNKLDEVPTPEQVGRAYEAFLADPRIAKKVDKKTAEALKESIVQDMFGLAWKVAWTGVQARKQLAAWAQIGWASDLPGVGKTLEISVDPFARMLAELLAYHGHLTVKREGDSATFAFNGKTYDKLRVIGDYEAIDLVATVATPPAPAKKGVGPKPVEPPKAAEAAKLVTTKPANPRLSVPILTLSFPDSTVTLQDVLEFSRGGLRVGNVLLRAEDLAEKFEKDELRLAAKEPAPSPLAKSLETSLKTLDKVLGRAFAARPGPKSGGDYVYSPLGRWLHVRLPTCRSLGALADVFIGLNCADTNTVSWPEVPDGVDAAKSPLRGLDPVSSLHSYVNNYFKVLERWGAQKGDLAQKVEDFKLSENYSVSALTLEFSTDDWASSHITPVIGGAGIITADRSFMIPYVGAQVFAWPNPVDQPMWTNGAADLRRLFGVELGLGIMRDGRTGFGPGDRYRNTSLGLPPVLLGVAIQPIPYVTTSVGVAFMRVQRSPLSAEGDQPFRALYINFSVQLNIFNAVRKLFVNGGYTDARKVIQ